MASSTAAHGDVDVPQNKKAFVPLGQHFNPPTTSPPSRTPPSSPPFPAPPTPSFSSSPSHPPTNPSAAPKTPSSPPTPVPAPTNPSSGSSKPSAMRAGSLDFYIASAMDRPKT